MQTIFSVIEAILQFLFFSTYMDLKKISRVKIYAYVTIAVIVGTIWETIWPNNIASLLENIIFVYLTGMCFYIGSVLKKNLLTLLYVFFSAMLDFTLVIICIYFFNADTDIPIYIIYITFKIILVFWLKLKRNRRDILGDNKVYVMQSIIPLLSIAFILVYVNFGTRNINSLISYLLIGIFLAINIIQYIIYEKVADMYIVKYERDMLEHRLQYLSEYYNAIESNMEKIRIIKHDMKNQLLMIRGYMEEEDEVAVEEINKMVLDLNYLGVQMFTKNSGVNAILNAKYNNARQAGVSVDYNIRFPERLAYIDIRDVVSILGNILDNAIESCQYVTVHKFIQFEMFYHNSFLVMHLTNSTDGKVSNLQTRKNNREWHGLGMKSVEIIINKYSGDSKWEFKYNTFDMEVSMWDVKI